MDGCLMVSAATTIMPKKWANAVASPALSVPMAGKPQFPPISA